MLKITSKIKPVVLCILDGWAIARDAPGNAITRANPQNFNRLWFSYPHTYLTAFGRAVGLPEGHVGNSEVGHENLGAGRIVFQDLLRINTAISNGSFFENEALLKTIDHINKNNSNIHLIGLVGLGFVHSSTTHLLELLHFLKKMHIHPNHVKLHIFTDGRDSPPASAKSYISEITNQINKENLGQIASISGRYFAMDRDNRWDRTLLAYKALVGTSQYRSYSSLDSIEKAYLEGVTDEFIKPTTIIDASGNPQGAVCKNDAVIFFNYRPDRARQLTRAFTAQDFRNVRTTSGDIVPTFNRGAKVDNLFFVTLTQYDKELPVSAIAFPQEEVIMPLARVFAERNLRQLHIAETEKYAHVTYFFNGGKETPFAGETRILVNSQKVDSYDQKPEMSTPEVTRQLIARLNARTNDLAVVNLANADMVAHTGNIEAAILAIKCVDNHLSVIVKSTLAQGGAVVVTADHGNAEEMINLQSGMSDTEHNINLVPLIIIAGELRSKSVQLNKGILADVAPTILAMLNISKPPQMTGRNLLG